MSFHILQYSTSFTAEERSDTVDVEPVSLCDCKNSGQGIDHDWPIFKGMPDNSYFVSYTEDGGCSYPELPRLAYDRNPRGSRWPYYDTLRDLDIRILRRVDLSETWSIVAPSRFPNALTSRISQNFNEFVSFRRAFAALFHIETWRLPAQDTSE